MQIEFGAPRKLDGYEAVDGPLEVKIISETDDNDAMTFDVLNCDASFANALRRIMLSEIPTVAIETVNLYMNRSVMQDEVLAHRLGLIPINIDASVRFLSITSTLFTIYATCI